MLNSPAVEHRTPICSLLRKPLVIVADKTITHPIFSNFFHMEKMSKPFMGSSVKVNPSMCCLPSHSNYQRSLPGISSFSVSQTQFRSKKTTSCLVLTSDRGLIFGNIIRANLKPWNNNTIDTFKISKLIFMRIILMRTQQDSSSGECIMHPVWVLQARWSSLENSPNPAI